MKGFWVSLVLTYLVFFTLLPCVTALEYAGSSAQLRSYELPTDLTESDYSLKEQAIRRVLMKYNSPLAGEAKNFVLVAKALDLDPYLLPSIAGVESTFAHAMIDGTYNPFGYGVGRIPFYNWGDGIARVGYALRYKYINRGAHTIDEIGFIYAGGSTTWGPKVESFMRQFSNEEKKIKRLDSLSNT